MILERLEIPAGLKANSVTKAQRRALEELLKGFTVSVTGRGRWRKLSSPPAA